MTTITEPTSTQIYRSMTDLLREKFQGRKELNPSYSLSSFARDLGISKSMLSRIFSGDRPITLKLAIQITAALDLEEAQSKRLILSVVQAASKNAKISKKVRLKLEKEMSEDGDTFGTSLYSTIEIERFKAMSSWHHLGILNLVKVKGFKNDSKWIAKRLGITTIEAQDGLERLFTLGLIAEKEEGVVRTSMGLYVKTKKSELAVRKFHEQMISKGVKELEETDQKSFQARLINGITFPCNSEHIELIKEKIIKLQDEILSLVTGDERESVYQMNVQFFPLTKDKKV